MYARWASYDLALGAEKVKRYRYAALAMLMLVMVIMILVGGYRAILHDVRSPNVGQAATHPSGQAH
jgi:hypothetical protein